VVAWPLLALWGEGLGKERLLLPYEMIFSKYFLWGRRERKKYSILASPYLLHPKLGKIFSLSIPYPAAAIATTNLTPIKLRKARQLVRGKPESLF
jgi:hypothetical protein